MEWNQCFLAQSVGRFREDLAAAVGAHGEEGLTDEQDELFTCVAGVAPGYHEVFANGARRNSGIGPYGEYAEFVETTLAEVETAGYTASGFAIGHRLGEAGFDLLAAAVIDAVAKEMAEGARSGTVIIARVRYDIRTGTGGGITVSACPEFGVSADDQQMETTMRWLQGEFAQRLTTPDVA